MTKRIGVVAGLTVDHLVSVDHGSKFNELGGPALYAALGARLVDGVVPVLAAALPDDDHRFRNTFAHLGIDTTHCSAIAQLLKVWILNSPEGRRIVTTAPVGDTELESGAAEEEGSDPELAPEFLQGLDGLLRSSPLGELTDADAATVVGVDPHQVPMKREGSAYLRRVLPGGAALLPSRVHLRPLGDDPRAAAARLSEEFSSPVFARLDVEGIYVVDRGRAWHIVDDAVRVEETTGAGDASAASIVAALAAGADPPTAAMFGASVARIALSAWGCTGLLNAVPITQPFNHIHATQEVAP
ncbi:PfkB family carbohydrate kinase [Dactylosporangium sp. NPDC048998]|uniref:PfkB family carbohydrate kinase n=1 Tax=Dactylosporangium sp. NPDC048998 TaxID=3363976 RepID=UPI00371BE3E0